MPMSYVAVRRNDERSVIHAYGNTELLERADIEEPLEENLGCGYCNLLSVA
jgi:hypothetical protein